MSQYEHFYFKSKHYLNTVIEKPILFTINIPEKLSEKEKKSTFELFKIKMEYINESNLFAKRNACLKLSSFGGKIKWFISSQ